jgi:serine/threonine protein kinase
MHACRFKREMTRHYELGKLIGAGTFGTVHEAVCRRTGRVFAVKTIHKRFTGQFLERKFVRRVQHEVDICMHMGNSLNVAHLFDVYEDDACVDLIMERCTGGELWLRIRKGDYTEQGALPARPQVCACCACAHSLQARLHRASCATSVATGVHACGALNGHRVLQHACMHARVAAPPSRARPFPPSLLRS